MGAIAHIFLQLNLVATIILTGGKGWPLRNQQRGDQIVRLKIAIPKTLSESEREYYEKLQQVRRDNPRRELEAIAL